MIKTHVKWVVMCFAMFLPTHTGAEEIPFSSDRWEVNARNFSVENYKGKEALFIDQGVVNLKGVQFSKGILEYDVLFEDNTRGFSGIKWHIQENGLDFENFYIRPHNSGQADANQYQPYISRGAWQLLFGPQFAHPTEYSFGEWMHVKVVVGNDKAEIYIDSEEPLIVVDNLLADLKTGGLGFSSGFHPVRIANFSYKHDDNPTMVGEPIPYNPPENLIKTWALSESMPMAETLTTAKNGSWVDGQIEANGILNIAKFRRYTQENNTVFAKITVHSSENQTKKFSFGYSDLITVYMGDQPVYTGSNLYRSRDYRYLGTVGLFDQVHLNLKEGPNDIYFAVTENFGGWGIMGRFENMDGLRLE